MGPARRASAFATTMVLATLVCGCGDGRTPTPIVAPTPPLTLPAPAPAPPVTLYSLSGTVFEMTAAGRTPVAGVEVYCEPCGPPDGHSARITDALGAYSFDGAGGVASGTIQMLLAKQGYVLPNQPDQSGPTGLSWMGSTAVTIRGDTKYDIEITRK